MSERPTPETDAEHAQFAMGGFTLDFCRKLERERDEARKKIERQAERIRHLEAATNHACGTPLSAALRERDELLQWKKGMLLVESQWDEQAVGRLLGLQLGDSIKPNIEPKLRQLIRERDEAQEIAEAFSALAWKLEGEHNEAREELEEEKRFHHRTHTELVQAQCKLMDLTQAIIDTLEENRHLADGDDCTLAKLKSVVPEWK